METVLQNLDARLLRVEQILPTLSTKIDLEQTEARLRIEIERSSVSLRDEIERSANQMRVLIEASRSENQLLAEHVLEILERFRGER